MNWEISQRWETWNSGPRFKGSWQIHGNHMESMTSIIHCFEENNVNHTVARNLNWYCYWKSCIARTTYRLVSTMYNNSIYVHVWHGDCEQNQVANEPWMVVNLVSGILKSIKRNSKVHSLEFSTKYNTKTLCTFFFCFKNRWKHWGYAQTRRGTHIWAIKVMCRCEGYGFQAVYARIGYINQSVWI